MFSDRKIGSEWSLRSLSSLIEIRIERLLGNCLFFFFFNFVGVFLVVSIEILA